MAKKITDCLGTHSCAEGFITVVVLCITELTFSKKLAVLKSSFSRISNKIVFVVNDTLKLTSSHVKDKTDARWHTLIEPDVGDWHSQVNVAHALATNAAQGNFHSTTVTDRAFVLDAFVFSASTLPVTRWTEDFLTEETTLFRFECPVVDRLRIEHFTTGPAVDGFRISYGNRNLIERIWLAIDSI